MDAPNKEYEIENRVTDLLQQMTLDEKIGQMWQADAGGHDAAQRLRAGISSGEIGSVLNSVDPDQIREMQRVAVEESRLGIPLLFGRDVIHGFATMFPIPLGQAASWNPDLVTDAARIAAIEASASGVNWTFAPMIDIARDPRWGRIAESPGEDPYLANQLTAAMVRGYQDDDPTGDDSIAACAKHFAGYGTAESGRDYATTNIPENELRNVYLPPFHAAVDAGVMTLMTSFSDLNGVPATANSFLLRQVLRSEWSFDGFVISDYDSVSQLAIHGLTEDDKASARAAARAGVDVEMAGNSFPRFLRDLVNDGDLPIGVVDDAARNVLRVKFRLGLFDRPYKRLASQATFTRASHLDVARQAALESIVLLKNDLATLPLSPGALNSVAVIGPLADAAHEQIGTWAFDANIDDCVTCLQATRSILGENVSVEFVAAMETSRSRDTAPFDEAVTAVSACDAALLFLGEEAILSGEAHSRANIDLPGAQAELVQRVRSAGKPVIAVVLAGRPLTLTNIIENVDALLIAWHPGTMGGPAIADVIFGKEVPSGKLPVSFPSMVGQIPIYYGRKNSGKPPSPEETVHIDDIDARAPQTSLGMTAFHLDAGYQPLFCFGYGLSYTEFSYDRIRCSAAEFRRGESVTISAELTNCGSVAAVEIAQLYVRDLVGEVTRPIRELKGFRRIRLDPGETTTVSFELTADDLAFYGRDNVRIVEPGRFHAWIGGNSDAELQTEFVLSEAPAQSNHG